MTYPSETVIVCHVTASIKYSAHIRFKQTEKSLIKIILQNLFIYVKYQYFSYVKFKKRTHVKLILKRNERLQSMA